MEFPVTTAQKVIISLLLSFFLTAGLIVLAHAGVFDLADSRLYPSADISVIDKNADGYGAGLFFLYRPDFVLVAAVFVTAFLIIFFLFNLKQDSAVTTVVNTEVTTVADAQVFPIPNYVSAVPEPPEKPKGPETDTLANQPLPSFQGEIAEREKASVRTTGRRGGLLAAADSLLASLPETPVEDDGVIYEQDGIHYINNGAFYADENSGENLDNNFAELVNSVTGEKPLTPPPVTRQQDKPE